MTRPDSEILAQHFEWVTISNPAYVCKHCGAMVTMTSWKVHVLACPALARWVRENPPAG